MSKAISPLIYIGGGLAAYFLFLKPKTQVSPSPYGIPGSGSTTQLTTTSSGIPSLSNLLNTTLPGVTPTTYGVNAGTSGSTPIISNYPALLAANPNLGNPNYQMSASENQQYLNNYLDLQQGLPTWIGHKQSNGVTPTNLQQAAQSHWNMYGCAEKRIFLPLQPPANIKFVPPPSNPKSTGSNILSGALSVATTVLPLLLGVDSDPKLSNADIEVLMTGGAILNDILPMYMPGQPIEVKQAQSRLTELVTQYS